MGASGPVILISRNLGICEPVVLCVKIYKSVKIIKLEAGIQACGFLTISL